MINSELIITQKYHFTVIFFYFYSVYLIYRIHYQAKKSSLKRKFSRVKKDSMISNFTLKNSLNVDLLDNIIQSEHRKSSRNLNRVSISHSFFNQHKPTTIKNKRLSKLSFGNRSSISQAVYDHMYDKETLNKMLQNKILQDNKVIL